MGIANLSQTIFIIIAVQYFFFIGIPSGDKPSDRVKFGTAAVQFYQAGIAIFKHFDGVELSGWRLINTLVAELLIGYKKTMKFPQNQCFCTQNSAFISNSLRKVSAPSW